MVEEEGKASSFLDRVAAVEDRASSFLGKEEEVEDSLVVEDRASSFPDKVAEVEDSLAAAAVDRAFLPSCQDILVVVDRRMAEMEADREMVDRESLALQWSLLL